MTEQLYNLAKIRDLLVNGFSNEDLRRLCFDVPDFRPVYQDLAPGTGTATIVDRLLEHADKTMQVPVLLALAEERNPERYELHGPYYAGNSAPAQEKQASDLAKRLASIISPASLTREQQIQIANQWVELGKKHSLRGFDLSDIEIKFATLAGADLRQVNLSSSNLNLCDLSGADLRGADLWGASLRKAKLSGANLSDAWLIDADLTEASLNQANLTEADLTGANFNRANLIEADLTRADLLGADLSNANLSGACLFKAQLHLANLQKTNIDECTGLDAKWQLVWKIVNETAFLRNLVKADLSYADLRGARFFALDLGLADLRGANLRGIFFGRSILVGANLSEADLREADLDLVDLKFANLRRANLHGAKVSDRILAQAKSLEGATMPDGTVHD